MFLLAVLWRQYCILRNPITRAIRRQLPDAITVLGILDQHTGRPAQHPLHRPDIARRARKIADRGKQRIGRQHWRKQRKNNCGKRDDDQRRKTNYEVLVAPEHLIFRATEQGIWSFHTEVRFPTLGQESRRVYQFV